MAEIIEMPKLSDTMTTGTLLKWLVKEGDAVSAGDMIAEVETDKATMEVENFEDGVLLKWYASEGDSVPVGGPICAIGAKGEDAPSVETAPAASSEAAKPDSSADAQPEVPAPAAPSSASDAPTAPSSAAPTPATAPAAASSDDSRIKASPLARKIAAEANLPLSGIQGSGPGGRITKDDVIAAQKAPKPAAAPAAAPTMPALADKSEKVSNMRAAIARALVKSKTEAPHFYLQSEINSAPLLAFRKDLNAQLADLAPEHGGAKFTVNDLILKAAAEAVRRVPAINRAWQGDEIVQFGSVHLAFGVAVDDGLLTPVIRDAQVKGLRAIAAEAKELIGKARSRKLKPDEMSGSTLTVTNLGMFGISDFYGIINPPNAAILSVGATQKRPVVDENDQIVVGYRMKIGLSGDHRVIDGAVGALYLDALRNLLEHPATILA